MEPAATGVSYRQVGKLSKGTIHRGPCTGQLQSGKNFSSIPSKFETTLFDGNKEKDGFGSRAHRFVESESELPGPGAYEEPAVRLRDDKVYSKKGLGVGFASQTKRKSVFVGNNVPGPGNYNTRETLLNSVKEHDRYNASGSSAPFKPASQRSVIVAEEPLPGPGQYHRHREFDRGQHLPLGPQTDMVFRSKSKQITFTEQPKEVFPAPGQYSPLGSHEVQHGRSGTLVSASFRSGVPISGRPSEARQTKEQQLGVVERSMVNLPGPGQYETKVHALSTGSRRRSPQFCDSNLDRFGRTTLALRNSSAPMPTPGPGAYHVMHSNETTPISSSAFMSETLRGGLDQVTKVTKGLPGPAYYTPADNAVQILGSKKSYHLNAVQRWMPL